MGIDLSSPLALNSLTLLAPCNSILRVNLCNLLEESSLKLIFLLCDQKDFSWSCFLVRRIHLLEFSFSLQKFSLSAFVEGILLLNVIQLLIELLLECNINLLELFNFTLGLGDLYFFRGFLRFNLLRGLSTCGLHLRNLSLQEAMFLNLGKVFALRFGDLQKEFLKGSGVLFLHFGDLGLESLIFFNFSDSLFLSSSLSSIKGLSFLRALLGDHRLRGLMSLNLKFEVGNLHLKLSIDGEELFDLDVEGVSHFLLFLDKLGLSRLSVAIKLSDFALELLHFDLIHLDLASSLLLVLLNSNLVGSFHLRNLGLPWSDLSRMLLDELFVLNLQVLDLGSVLSLDMLSVDRARLGRLDLLGEGALFSWPFLLHGWNLHLESSLNALELNVKLVDFFSLLDNDLLRLSFGLVQLLDLWGVLSLNFLSLGMNFISLGSNHFLLVLDIDRYWAWFHLKLLALLS